MVQHYQQAQMVLLAVWKLLQVHQVLERRLLVMGMTSQQAGLLVGLPELLEEEEPEVALPGRAGRPAGSVVA